MKIRSMVGLIPLFAVETLEPEVLDKLPDFKQAAWSGSSNNRPDLTANLACMRTEGRATGACCRLSMLTSSRRMLQAHAGREGISLAVRDSCAVAVSIATIPISLRVNGMEHRVDYEPGESTTGLFGGNSNWRGPIWFPMNYLLIESLQKFHHYFGDRLSKSNSPPGRER